MKKVKKLLRCDVDTITLDFNEVRECMTAIPTYIDMDVHVRFSQTTVNQLSQVDQPTVKEVQGRTSFTPDEVMGFWANGRHEDLDAKRVIVQNIAKGWNVTNINKTSDALDLFRRSRASSLYAVRMAHPKLMKQSRGINGTCRSTLILLGNAKAFTGLHLDWTEACNIAFSIGQGGGVLALWLFVHPTLASAADAWLKDHGWPQGFSTPDKVHLVGMHRQQFMTSMNAIKSDGCVLIEQHAGHMIHVPPGWIHQVTNIRPCLKVAWDYYIFEHFHYYAMLQSRIASPLFGNAMAEDYMAVNAVVEDMLRTSKV